MGKIFNSTLLFLLFVTIASCKKDKKEAELPNEPLPQLGIAVGKGPDAMFLTPDETKLYIANVEDTTISVINTITDKVVHTITGIRNPWGFAQLGSSTEVAVSAYDYQLAVVDFTNNLIVREKTFSSHLGGITVDSIGQYLYVVAIDSKKILKIDAVTLDSLDNFDTGNGPDGIGISKDNQKIYVTNTSDGTISIININTKTTTIINAGGKPELIHGNYDNSLLYISNFNDNKTHVLNTSTDSITHEITGLNGPEEVVPNKSNDKLYIVNFNSAKVFVYSIPNYNKLSTEYITGAKPIGVTSLNNKLYVTNYGDNSVSVIEK